MSEEKITITMDDVEQATPVGTPGTSSSPMGGYAPENPPTQTKRTGLYAGIAVAVLVCLICIVIGFSRGQSVADYRRDMVREINNELASPNSALKKFIEDAHWTVDVTSAKVVECKVTTMDGSDNAGRNGSNVSQVSMLIRFQWKGFVDTGRTDFRLVLDVPNDTVMQASIVYTDAMVNTQDIGFWWDLGTLVGTVLALL